VIRSSFPLLILHFVSLSTAHFLSIFSLSFPAFIQFPLHCSSSSCCTTTPHSPSFFLFFLILHRVSISTPHSPSCFPFLSTFFTLSPFPFLILHPASVCIPHSSSSPLSSFFILPPSSVFILFLFYSIFFILFTFTTPHSSSCLPLPLLILHPVFLSTPYSSFNLPFPLHILHPVPLSTPHTSSSLLFHYILFILPRFAFLILYPVSLFQASFFVLCHVYSLLFILRPFLTLILHYQPPFEFILFPFPFLIPHSVSLSIPSFFILFPYHSSFFIMSPISLLILIIIPLLTSHSSFCFPLLS
jgi:hypothetical protein